MVIGLAAGSYAMSLKNSKDVNKAVVDTASKMARSQIMAASVIYGAGADNKEITLQAIDVINKPEFANFFNDEVKAFAEEAHKKIEDGVIAPPSNSK